MAQVKRYFEQKPKLYPRTIDFNDAELFNYSVLASKWTARLTIKQRGVVILRQQPTFLTGPEHLQ